MTGLSETEESEREEIQRKELEILNFIRPYLKDSPRDRGDGTWTPPPGLIPDLTKILVTGIEWLTHEARKKEVRAYRRQLEKARSLRDKSPALRHLFPASQDFPKGGTPIRQDADALSHMLAECDRILGTREPTRHTRRATIKAALILWEKHTGKPPQKWAIQPSVYSGDKEAPPYAFCRLVLTLVENKDPGDFRRIYESAVRSIK